MRPSSVIYLLLFILGLTVAVAPWTFAPVCISEMRCWVTRDVETVLGLLVAFLSLVGMFVDLRGAASE